MIGVYTALIIVCTAPSIIIIAKNTPTTRVTGVLPIFVFKANQILPVEQSAFRLSERCDQKHYYLPSSVKVV
jgi:hypothetical protein